MTKTLVAVPTVLLASGVFLRLIGIILGAVALISYWL